MYIIKGQLVLYLGLGDSYGCHWTSLKCIQSKGNLLLYLGLGDSYGCHLRKLKFIQSKGN